MAIQKQIVCLANSRKPSGRCIAGREWSETEGAGAWVRPVSERDGQEVSEYERQYEDGADPRLLDIIDVPLLEARPEDWQTENWLLDPEHYWQKNGKYSRFDLAKLANASEPLWIDGHSTYGGQNDKVPLALTSSISDSLRLIRVERLELAVFRPGEAFGNAKRRVQGRFEFSGQEYALWVTDPACEKKYLAKLDGTYATGGSYLTISLGERYKGACYKLIAAVIGVDE